MKKPIFVLLSVLLVANLGVKAEDLAKEDNLSEGRDNLSEKEKRSESLKQRVVVQVDSINSDKKSEKYAIITPNGAPILASTVPRRVSKSDSIFDRELLFLSSLQNWFKVALVACTKKIH